MNTTVIIPTYNEKDNIGNLIPEVFKAAEKVKNHNVNILIVDDNSPDGTQEVVKKLQKKYKNLHLITGKKEGLGKAYLRGMKYAVESLDAEVMFEMDADFSHDPKRIPAFLKEVDKGADVVIGSRYIPGGSIPDNWGFHRKLFSVVGNLIVRAMLLNFKHKDWTTGYRAIRTPIYKKVRKELDGFKGYTFQVSFLHKTFQHDAHVVEVPIKFVDRVYGKSKIGSEYVINLMQYLITTNIKNPPRQLRFLVVGTIGFLVQSIVFGIGKRYLLPELANGIGAVMAITSNFLLNNFWTFGDRRHKIDSKILGHYLKFMILSSGSILIQTIAIAATRLMLGPGNVADWTGFILGVGLGLFWNYTIYNRVIWKK